MTVGVPLLRQWTRMAIPAPGAEKSIPTSAVLSPAAVNRAPGSPAFAQDAVELLLVGRVVGDRCRGVLQLMTGEYAGHAVTRGDDALLAEQLGAGDAGGAGWFAAEAVGAHLGLGVEHLLIGHL